MRTSRHTDPGATAAPSTPAQTAQPLCPPALLSALRGTALQGHAIRPLWPSGSTNTVFAIDLAQAPSDTEWAALMPRIKRVGKYPVLTDRGHAEAQFATAPQAPSGGHELDYADRCAEESLSVGATLFQASGGGQFSAAIDKRDELFTWLDFPLDHGHGSHPIARILKRFGDAPSIEQIRDLRSTGHLRTDADLERWLWQWEIAHFGEAALQPEHPGYQEPRELSSDPACTVVLLPTSQSWKALLYMGWWGTGEYPSGQAAVMRRWQRRYGAEITRGFLTTLHLRVRRRPQTVAEAFALAVEHCKFTNDVLGDNGSLRDHARTLLTADRWYFHHRN